jgi:hypothetical protein
MACTQAPLAAAGLVGPLLGSPRSRAAAVTRVPDPVGRPACPTCWWRCAAGRWWRAWPSIPRSWSARRGHTRPCQATRHRVCCPLEGLALAAALRASFAPVAVPLPVRAGRQGHRHGKAPCGRRPVQSGGWPAAHAPGARGAWPGRVRSGEVRCC